MKNHFQKFEYEVKNGEVIINSCFSVGSVAEIPEEIEGYPVVEIAPYAFAWDVAKLNFATSPIEVCPVPKLNGERLEEIIIPKTVKRIGRYAFYNCKNLRRIEFYNTLTDLGAGAFTGCHKVREIKVSFIANKKSILREFLVDLPEEQMVELCYEDGCATVLFPEFFEESIENTPARNLEVFTHGSGMMYRNCFVRKELDFVLYDERFEWAKGKEFEETVFLLAFQRLYYPYQLAEKFAYKYKMYLKENLQECALWAVENDFENVIFYLADNCVEKAEELDTLIAAVNEKSNVELLSYLMNEKHKKFKTRRKSFEL